MTRDSIARNYRAPEATVRNVRVPEHLWAHFVARTDEEWTYAGTVMLVCLRAYAERDMDAPEWVVPTGGEGRSFKCPPTVWAAAKGRAESEGTTVSEVLRRFVAAYASGVLSTVTVVLLDERPS